MAASTIQAPATKAKKGPKPKAPSAGPICNGETYSLDDFKARSRWSDTAIRMARRNGLTMVKAGNILYVRGEDFNAYLEKLAQAETQK
jgi:hypothetical protein